MTEDTNLFMKKIDPLCGEADRMQTDIPIEESPLECAPEQTVHLVFLGSDIEMPLSEAIKWAQKGMNAERAIAREQNAPERELFAFYAEACGLTREGLIDLLKKRSMRLLEERELSQLLPRCGGMQEEDVRALARQGAQRWMAQYEQRQEERRRVQQREALRPWEVMLCHYPKIHGYGDLPQDAAEAINQGYTPLEAMLLHENTALKERAAQLEELFASAEKNLQNRMLSTGSVRGRGAALPKDAFLRGMA